LLKNKKKKKKKQTFTMKRLALSILIGSPFPFKSI